MIAVIGGPKIHALGYLYAVLPAGSGACILLFVTLVVNNLAAYRRLFPVVYSDSRTVLTDQQFQNLL